VPHLEVALLRGGRQDLLELAARPDILDAVTTADGMPLSVVVPGGRYPEIESVPRIGPPHPLRLASGGGHAREALVEPQERGAVRSVAGSP
jgi:hypothetical protein